MTLAFTLVFVAALGATAATRVWLALRQARHVRRHRDAVPETFAGTIPLESHQKAADYSVAKVRLSIADIAIGAAATLALTLGGGLQAIADGWAALAAPGGLWHGAATIVTMMLVLSAIELPVEAWRTFVVEERFGFNRMTPALFVADLAKNAAVGLALGVPLLLVVLWLMERMGANWWLWVWLAWAGFNLVMLVAYPTLIAPLFNRFTPLDDPAIAARLEALRARCGFRSSGLYVMDGSRRSAHGNAYFTGFGAAKRIVLFDTLLARLAPPEIEAVLAHELGHYRRHHVWKRVAALFAFSLALLWVLGRLAAESWFFEGLGVRAPSTPMALALFFLVLPAFTFFLQPLSSLYSRRHEFEADAYAAAHAASADLVAALVKLYKDNAATLTPDPLHSAFYDSHPPAAARIARLRAAAQE